MPKQIWILFSANKLNVILFKFSKLPKCRFAGWACAKNSNHMAKSLSNLWLKSARRIGKAQQAQGNKLFKSLLKQAVKTTSVAKTAKTAKTVKTRTTANKPAVKRASSGRLPSKPKALKAAGIGTQTTSPGSWQKAFFCAAASPAVTVPRRLLYWLYIPAKAAAKPLPLVVMLHGCRQSAADFATSTRMNALAERKGFAVLYPQQSVAQDANRCWPWYKVATLHGQGDVAVIAAMVEKFSARHGFDRSRTYVAGLSAGSGLAALLALRYPALFAAVGLHSGPVFGVADSALSAYRVMQSGSAAALSAAAQAVEAQALLMQGAGMPAILLHGSRDAVVRRVNLQQLTQQFAVLNAPLTGRALPVPKIYPERAGRKPRLGWTALTYYAGRKPQIVSCEVSGLGHAWSGGDASVPFSDAKGPDASAMMWAFFARHKRGKLAQ